MKSIWKYTMKTHNPTFKIPKGFKVLSIANQYNEIVLYCLVDSNSVEYETVEFEAIGTGWEAYDTYFDNKEFIGTVVTHEGSLIWHIFMIIAN